MAKRRFNIIVFVSWLVAVLFAVLVGYCIYTVVVNGEHRPLSTAEIPQSTKDWFKDLIDGGSDIGGIFTDSIREKDWTRYESIEDMKSFEDDLFVFYYSSKDSVKEREKALVCQRYAHEAVPVGDAFMKGYPYPSSEKMKGRKLPIFLANTEDDFRSICKQLGCGDPGTWAVGLYCFMYNAHGSYCKGVIISPKAWNVDEKHIDSTTNDPELKRVLWHEMNHFMYFTNMNFLKSSPPNLWFTEGLAEYFAESMVMLQAVRNHKKFNLTDDFQDGSSEYWVGISAYLCMEELYGKNIISNIVTNSYDNSIDKAVQMAVSGENLESWNSQWHLFMENKEYRKYMRNNEPC